MVLPHPDRYNSPDTAEFVDTLNGGAQKFRRDEKNAKARVRREREERRLEQDGGGSDEKTTHFLGNFALDGVIVGPRTGH